MADYTDTLTYSVSLDGVAYTDTITETVSSGTECMHYTAKAGTGVGDTIFTTNGNSPFDLDINHILIINRDQTQDCEIKLSGGSDTIAYQIPPNGFVKFTFEGSGTYAIETQGSATQSAWQDIGEIIASFDYNEGLLEVIAIEV